MLLRFNLLFPHERKLLKSFLYDCLYFLNPTQILLRYFYFEPSFKLIWCRARDLFGSQIPVTARGFKLQISCIWSYSCENSKNALWKAELASLKEPATLLKICILMEDFSEYKLFLDFLELDNSSQKILTLFQLLV